jgi:hypothetical protein
MHVLSRTFRATLLLIVAVNCGMALGSDEARAQADPLAKFFLGEHGSYAIPPNYRELIARYALTVAQRMNYTQEALRTARIATPYNKPDGLWGRLTGESVPTVCVSFDGRNADDIRSRGMWGESGKMYWMIYFENGELHTWGEHGTVAVILSECGTFSPFTEVMKR